MNELTAEDIRAFEPDAKIALLATVDPDGLPHITLITSLMAKGPRQLMWGQFIEGASKRNVRRNPKTGWLVLSMDRKLWRGTAEWTGCVQEGPDYIVYNQKPMFRYNTYFGIHTVHHMDLVDLEGRRGLPIPGLLAGALVTPLAGPLARPSGDARPLKPWARKHLARPTTLKFLAYIGADGYPRLVPVVPSQPAAAGQRIVFAPTVYARELRSLEAGAPLALFGMNMEMESVLVRGRFRGYVGRPPLALGAIDIDWVYNSMPPLPGQVYPEPPLEPVSVFA